ncbi:MAG: hypothetical protein ACOCQQ_02800 [Candidatus Nanoarchaeia archaeon]
MIRTYSTTKNYQAIYSQLYENFKDIHTLLKCQKKDSFYQMRILQNRFTNKFCLCDEQVDYTKKTAKIQMQVDDKAHIYCEELLAWMRSKTFREFLHK